MKKHFGKIFYPTLTMALLLMGSLIATDRQVELKFSHKLHTVENGLECDNCHSGASASMRGTDDLLPTMETCGNCHDIEDEENCQMCHSDLENPRAVPRITDYSKLFPHKTHIAAGLNCEDCHSQVKVKTEVGAYLLPKMASCMDCHSQRKVSRECSTCHLPEERLKPLTHGPDFLHNHSNLARIGQSASDASSRQNCNMCHQTSFCQKCHEGDNLDRTTHPLNYAYTHSLDARGKERDCAACHTERSFCITCHAQNLVMPHNHTVGWSNRIPGDGGRHSIEARNDLENCMACHEQDAEQVCQKCHLK